MHWYNQLSLVVTTAPSCRSRARAIGTSSLLQLLTPSARTYTLCPSCNRSIAVCVTSRKVSICVVYWRFNGRAYANVGLDADDDAGERRFEGGEALADFWCAVNL
jgi:hypothetical protein